MTILILFLLSFSLFFNCSKDSKNDLIKDTEKTIKKTIEETTGKVERSIKEETEKVIKNIESKVEEVSKSVPSVLPEISIENLTIKELWEKYRESRKEAEELKENGNYQESIEKLLIAAKCAKKLDRPDIASWQMNNAAKHCIDFYKFKTDYDSRISKLNQMVNNEEKTEYIKETNSIFKDNMKTLEKGLKYLDDASQYNEQKPDSLREKVISNNLLFIHEINDFLVKTN